ncbi:HEPN domain-containing protein [Candidatus Dojkabacteria bacterium]|nr:HEPN domain-containing protein [Candidatus Dojkabacteria bacterium]
MLKRLRTLGTGERYKVWLKQAEFDFEAAKSSKLSGFFEWACFQCEQAVEKALKAVLVKAGWRPPKMHKLAVLMSYCNRANGKFRQTKFEFRDLESFTFVSRYPFLIPGENLSPHEFISSDDAERCIIQARTFLDKIHSLLEE